MTQDAIFSQIISGLAEGRAFAQAEMAAALTAKDAEIAVLKAEIETLRNAVASAIAGNKG